MNRLFSTLPVILLMLGLGYSVSATPADRGPTRTLVMVWDGLRPDSINPTDTPNLYALQSSGVNFLDNHSNYPSFTMMNAQAFATGSFPGMGPMTTKNSPGSGFYGNTFWAAPSDPRLSEGRMATNTDQHHALFISPVFTEDHLILDQLNDYYQSQGDPGILLVSTLFKEAQRAGLKTAAIGKSGPAFIQDLTPGDASQRVFIDENSIRPAALVRDLMAAHYPLPAHIQFDSAYQGERDPTGQVGGLQSYLKTQTAEEPTYFAPGAALLTGVYNDPVHCGGCTASQLSSTDPSEALQGASENASNQYMMHVFKDFILADERYRPDLAVVWFRTPDNAEHSYGPGTANVIAALRSQDARLGELIEALKTQGMFESTNIIVVSDHGHSTVSGPQSTFPLLSLEASSRPPVPYKKRNNSSTTSDTGREIGPGVSEQGSYRGTQVDNGPGPDFGQLTPAKVGGYAFSGDIRLADVLYYRGLDAFDGAGCLQSAMAGLVQGKTPVKGMTLKKESRPSEWCAKPAGAQTYMAISAPEIPPSQRESGGTGRARADFRIKSKAESYASNFVMTTNQGGTDYVYVPAHDGETVAKIVRILQQRPEVGAIFVDHRYLTGGENAPATPIAGVIPMQAVNLENLPRKDRGQPDIVVSFNWDGTRIATNSTVDQGTVVHVGQRVQGMSGTTFESLTGRHGMHGGSGTTDIHNTLIARGPSFKSQFKDVYPTGNVDVAPTVAYLLGIPLPSAQGRILNEALLSPTSPEMPRVTASLQDPSAFGVPKVATGLRHESLTDMTGETPARQDLGDPETLDEGSYTIELALKDLTLAGQTYRYFDYARAIRH